MMKNLLKLCDILMIWQDFKNSGFARCHNYENDNLKLLFKLAGEESQSSPSLLNFSTVTFVKVNKSQKHFSWNSIAQKTNEILDKILP